jgi:hypothetical protein
MMSMVQAALDQQTMTHAMQPLRKKSGIGAAETGESVTPGRIRKRKRLDSQRNFTPDNITLGAMSTGVKQYNVGLNSSIILARCNWRWNGRSAVLRGS